MQTYQINSKLSNTPVTGKNKILNDDEYSIAVYNTVEKKCIGLFINTKLVAKYLFNTKDDRYNNPSRLLNNIRLKAKVTKTKLGIIIALRRCNLDQQQLLGEKDYLIFDGYPKFEAKRVFHNDY